MEHFYQQKAFELPDKNIQDLQRSNISPAEYREPWTTILVCFNLHHILSLTLYITSGKLRTVSIKVYSIHNYRIKSYFN